jgi:hypothetical protein
VTRSSSVSSWVVRELWDVRWWSASWVPARFQGSSSWIGGIPVDWITINEVANLCVSTSSSGIGDATWYLKIKTNYKSIEILGYGFWLSMGA